MQVIYYNTPIENFPKTFYHTSIFLAGPTRRNTNFEIDDTQRSWRLDALDYLLKIGYEGVVFVPEFISYMVDNEMHIPDNMKSKDNIIIWELTAINMSDVMLFWIPRNNTDLKGLTTNVEFGKFLNNKTIFYGRSDDAAQCNYLDFTFNSFYNNCKHIHNNLNDLIDETVKYLNKHYDYLPDCRVINKPLTSRFMGLRCVPIDIFKSEEFLTWYNNLCVRNFNVIDDVEVLWKFDIHKLNRNFSFLMKVNIYVDEEKRNKSNEYIYSRPDVMSVICYYKDDYNDKIYYLLTKEFRSTVNNLKNMVIEPPSGSSFNKSLEPITVISKELYEETGIKADDLCKFKYIGSRQINSTVSIHRNHIFIYKLNDKELDHIKYSISNNVSYGNSVTDSEITYLQLSTIDEIKSNEEIDWATVGYIMFANDYILKKYKEKYTLKSAGYFKK